MPRVDLAVVEVDSQDDWRGGKSMKVRECGLGGVVRKLSPAQGQQKLAAEARPRSALRGGYGLAMASFKAVTYKKKI